MFSWEISFMSIGFYLEEMNISVMWNIWQRGWILSTDLSKNLNHRQWHWCFVNCSFHHNSVTGASRPGEWWRRSFKGTFDQKFPLITIESRHQSLAVDMHGDVLRKCDDWKSLEEIPISTLSSSDPLPGNSLKTLLSVKSSNSMLGNSSK